MGTGWNSLNKDVFLLKNDYFIFFCLFTLFCPPIVFRWWLCFILHQEIFIANTYMCPGPDTVPRALHILSHLMKWKQSGRNSLCCIMPNLQKFPSYLSNLLSLILKFINFSASIMGYTYHSKPMLMFGLICLYFCKKFTPEIMLFFDWIFNNVLTPQS